MVGSRVGIGVEAEIVGVELGRRWHRIGSGRGLRLEVGMGVGSELELQVGLGSELNEGLKVGLVVGLESGSGRVAIREE